LVIGPRSGVGDRPTRLVASRAAQLPVQAEETDQLRRALKPLKVTHLGGRADQTDNHMV